MNMDWFIPLRTKDRVLPILTSTKRLDRSGLSCLGVSKHVTNNGESGTDTLFKSASDC